MKVSKKVIVFAVLLGCLGTKAQSKSEPDNVSAIQDDFVVGLINDISLLKAVATNKVFCTIYQTFSAQVDGHPLQNFYVAIREIDPGNRKALYRIEDLRLADVSFEKSTSYEVVIKVTSLKESGLVEQRFSVSLEDIKQLN